MRLSLWLFAAVLILAGCSLPGENEDKKDETNRNTTDRVEATANTTVKTTKPSALIGGNLDMAANAKLEIKYEGKPPVEEVETSTEKTLASDAFLDLSIRSIYSKHSAWFYVILLGVAFGAWKLYNTIKNSPEGHAIRGGLRALTSVVRVADEALQHAEPGTDEHLAYSKVKSDLQAKLAKLSLKAKP